jgi:hypothetical protein
VRDGAIFDVAARFDDKVNGKRTAMPAGFVR